jgi:trigger factor
LAGKKALFVVDIKNVLRREFPEINDTFAKEASEFGNLADWRKDIKVKLEANAKARVESELKNELLKQIIDGTKVDVPEKMIQMKLAEIMEDMRMQLARQGATIEMYAQYLNQTVQQIIESQRENAVKATKAHLVLNEIIVKEGIEVTEQELKEKIDAVAAGYDTKTAKKFKNDANMEYLREDIKFEKLVSWLIKNNSIIC